MDKMLRSMRLRLTVLYLLAGLILVALVSGGIYLATQRYLQQTIDLSLHHKMVGELKALGQAIPNDLAAADALWRAARENPLVLLVGSPASFSTDGEEHEEEEEHEEHEGGGGAGEEMFLDSGQASIFVIPLDHTGALAAGSGLDSTPFTPSAEAFYDAVQFGSDLRTVYLSDGTGVRLLTYSVSGIRGVSGLQLGQSLSEQQRSLQQLLLVLVISGGGSIVLLGVGGWWLAGRSIQPARMAWERQQLFVANASHELRTPLTFIRASTEVARRKLGAAGKTGELPGLLDDVLSECDHMGKLVEDLLLLSRLDSGQMAFERQPLLLREVVSDVGRQVERLANEKGLVLELDLGNETVWGDASRLRQVLIVVLDNALQHTAEGCIRVDTRRRGQKVDLRIADTGSGIEPEHLERVFERFYQVDAARTGSNSGLGLTIARALVEAQGGEIKIASMPGEGTEVVITLAQVK